MRSYHPADRIFVALDVPDLDEARGLAAQLRGRVGGFKVGLELCTSEGVPFVAEALGLMGGLFFDLKLKDIPNTVASAIRALGRFGGAVRFITLYCDGGGAMLRAAVEAVHSLGDHRPRLLGVTVLTSFSAETLGEVGMDRDMGAQVVRLAQLAQASGLDGVVASPHEVAAIRAACGPNLLIVTPGVRPTWAATDDQQRVMTPREALQAGADYLVIGRPITAAPFSPLEAVEKILSELE